MQHVLNIPNSLTLLRILLILPIIILLSNKLYLLATILAAFAFFTDYLDGYWARKTKATTALGSLLDPIADKFILLGLTAYFAFTGLLTQEYFILSATRDTLQLLAIPVLLHKKIPFKVKPKPFAKIATTLKYLILATLILELLTHKSLEILLFTFVATSTLFEVCILFTFITRFTQIYRRKHDTFE